MKSEQRHEERAITWREETSAAFPLWVIRRWRDSRGQAGIDVKVLQYADSGGHEYAEFSFSSSMLGDAYESRAREFLAVLGAACDEECKLN